MQKTNLLISTVQATMDRPKTFVRSHLPGVGVLLGWLAFLLYAGSFFLPATGNMMGYQAFWCALVFVIFLPMWAANPAFLVGLAWLSQGRYKSNGNAGLLALALALSESWMFYPELGVGYFTWVASMAVLAVAGWCGHPQESRQKWPGAPQGLTVGEAARIAGGFRKK
jgi:hypothetical protein